MLKGIPSIISPELLKTLDEMGHNDVIVLADGNFPGSGIASAGNAKLVRADGVGAAEMLEAILQLIPTDIYVDTPILLIDKEGLDKDLPTPIWSEFEKTVSKYDARGASAIGKVPRMDFYEASKKAYAIIQTTESALYACLMIRKGVIK